MAQQTPQGGYIGTPIWERPENRVGLPAVALIDKTGQVSPEMASSPEALKYDLMILGDRNEEENPGALEACPNLAGWSVSFWDLVRDWENHQTSGQKFLQYRLGEAATELAAWMPKAGDPGRHRGTSPAVYYWNQDSGLANISRRDWLEAWAALVAEHHLWLESQAGKELVIRIDAVEATISWINNIQLNIQEGILMDADADGEPDSPQDLDSMAAMAFTVGMSLLRAKLPDRIIFTNGTGPQQIPADGRQEEDLGRHDHRTWQRYRIENAERQGFGPSLHIVSTIPEQIQYGLAASLLLEDQLLVITRDWSIYDSWIWDPSLDREVGPAEGGGAVLLENGWIRRLYGKAVAWIREDTNPRTGIIQEWDPSQQVPEEP